MGPVGVQLFMPRITTPVRAMRYQPNVSGSCQALAAFLNDGELDHDEMDCGEEDDHDQATWWLTHGGVDRTTLVLPGDWVVAGEGGSFFVVDHPTFVRSYRLATIGVTR